MVAAIVAVVALSTFWRCRSPGLGRGATTRSGGTQNDLRYAQSLSASLCRVGFGLSTPLWIAVVLLALGGVAVLVSTVHRGAILQTAATDEMRGWIQGSLYCGRGWWASNGRPGSRVGGYCYRCGGRVARILVFSFARAEKGATLSGDISE